MPAESWSEEMDAECIRISWGHMPSVVIGALVSSLVTGVILRAELPSQLVFGWVSAVWLHALVRLGLYRVFRRRSRDAQALRTWWWVILVAMGSAGALYGSILLVVEGEPSLLVVTAMALSIAGSIAGGSQSIVATPLVLIVASTSAIVPLLVVVLRSPVAGLNYLGISFLAFLATVIVIGRNNYTNLRATLAMRYENVELVAQLAEKNREKTRFLGAASHDLRQPIHALRLFAGALAPEVSGERAQHLVGRIETSVDALSQLLDGLLDISRLDAGVIAVEARPFPATALATQLHALFDEPARERGIGLRIVPSDLWIAADPDMVGQLVRNLVANAIRYTPRGRVLVCFRRRGECVRVQVWDTGIGIAPDQQRAIFREFHQLGNPERDRLKGIGLGLAIVERIGRLLGTEVGVRSTPGKGSVFWVDLPLAEPGVVTPITPAPAAPAIGRAILVIDDDALAREGLVAILEAWGHRVVAIADPDGGALAAMRAQPIELVITDYRLREDRTALDALAAVEAELGALPAIVLTGETDPARIRAAHATGHAVLFKPVVPDELRATISRLLP